MTPSRLRAAAALTFAFIAASCGGGDGGTGPTFSDSVSTADAQEFAGDLVGDVAQATQQLNFGEGSIGLSAPAFIRRMSAQRPQLTSAFAGHHLLAPPERLDWRSLVARPAGLQAAADEGCTITQSGFSMDGPVDVDQNGFPDNFYIKQECLQTDSTNNADTTFSSYLLIEERVKQNFASLYGYDITIRLVNKNSDEFGNFSSNGFDASEGLDIRGGAAGHQFSYVFHEEFKQDTASGAYRSGVNWNVSFDPDGTIVLGDPLPDGALTLNGREYVTDTEDQNLSFSLATDTPLAYDATCWAGDALPPFTAGILIGHLNNNASSASFSATFTGCGVEPTISTEGTHDPVPVAARR
jgi:hypothetical protein